MNNFGKIQNLTNSCNLKMLVSINKNLPGEPKKCVLCFFFNHQTVLWLMRPFDCMAPGILSSQLYNDISWIGVALHLHGFVCTRLGENISKLGDCDSLAFVVPTCYYNRTYTKIYLIAVHETKYYVTFANSPISIDLSFTQSINQSITKQRDK